ncbi:MAG TPA: NAD(P)H-dependent oxidoreductase [Polyangiaceae bacterium]|nr:NAD(P)H-dependent oxidoreductase [Polyangiaceae bacterium]
MNVLHVDASVRTEGSTSRELSRHFVDALRKCVPSLGVDRLDLAKEPPRHFGALETAAVSTAEARHTDAMRRAIADSDALVARVHAADALVIGTPIYNFGMPRALRVALGPAALRHVLDDDRGDVRPQDLEEPARVGALLEAQVLGAGDVAQGLDERLAVGLDDAMGELLALGIEHHERAACRVRVQSDISLHRRPPELGRSWCPQQQLFAPRQAGATCCSDPRRFEAAQPEASPT